MTRFILEYPVVCLSVLLAACGNGSQAPSANGTAGVRPSPATADPTSPPALDEPIRAADVPPSPTLPGDDLRVLFDLAARADDAHLRSQGLLVDFGTPSRFKYTLGDWKTGWRGNQVMDGVTVSCIEDSAARVFVALAPDEAGPGLIVLRARSLSGQRSTGRVYLNGASAGTMTIGSAGFDHGTVEVPSLRSGVNEILLRFEGTGKGPDGQPARLAVDYLRVIPDGVDEGGAAAVFAPVEDGRIILHAGESLTWNLPIVEPGLLRGALTSAGKGRLEVRIATDGAQLSAGTFEADATGRPLLVPLSTYAGDALSLTLAVREGEVAIENAVIAAEPSPPPVAPGRFVAKNVVLVLIDTLRADHLSVLNAATRVRTPFLDAFAKECMVFERAMPQENWTKPSIASLLTGLYAASHQTKGESNRLPSSATMVSEHLRSLGFETAGFVANGYISDKFGFERGWDTWTNYVREGKKNRAQFVAQDVIAWLNRRREGRPFFLYVHTIDPHVPYQPPTSYRAMYDDEPYDGIVEGGKTAQLLEQIKTGAVRLSERDRFRLEALYDGEISYHDDHLALIAGELRKLGLLEDTLIVITSDHGEEFFDHGDVGHGHTLYEELLHVPLLVRLPGAAPQGQPVRDAGDAELVDVLPTICDSLQVACPPAVQGRSLGARLTGQGEVPWPAAARSEFMDGQLALRTARYKLIYRGLRTTLFDLRDDPKETADLSDARPVALSALRDMLGTHMGRFASAGSLKGAQPSPVVHRREEATIDPETRKQLEELGYMGEKK